MGVHVGATNTTATEGEAYIIWINGADGELLVKVGIDGKCTFGPNYQPDEAARVFWSALADSDNLRGALVERILNQLKEE